MPVLPEKIILTKAEEGKLVDTIEPLHRYFVVSSKQLQEFHDSILEVISNYNKTTAELIDRANIAMAAQKAIANYLLHITEAISSFSKISLVISLPHFNEIQTRVVPIYIQPDEDYISTKSLPSHNRKQTFPLKHVVIKEEGFMLNGDYIHGMTTKSQTGKLFELMIRTDTQGILTDKLVGQTLGINQNRLQEAVPVVLHDLKRILKRSKIVPNMHRRVGAKEYKVHSLTKYIRKRNLAKKTKNKA